MHMKFKFKNPLLEGTVISKLCH